MTQNSRSSAAVLADRTYGVPVEFDRQKWVADMAFTMADDDDDINGDDDNEAASCC